MTRTRLPCFILILSLLSFVSILSLLSFERVVQFSRKSLETSSSSTNDPALIPFDYDGGLDNNGEIRPTFFLHLGPKKTGTTTIQCSFHKSTDMLAATSSYRYVGRRCGRITEDDPRFREDLFDADVTETLSGVEQLSAELLLHLREGNSPIYSSERLSTVITGAYDWKQGNGKLRKPIEPLVSLIDSVKKEGFNVKPILAYRRFYEWVPSYYHQKIDVLSTFSEFENPDCRISLRSWFDLAPNCAGFPDYFTDNHPLLKVSRGLKHVFGIDDFAIMNLHQRKPEDEGEILASFVRQVLPDSENFHKMFTKDMKIDPLNISETKDTDMYHLVAAAYTTEKLMKPTKSPASRVIREVKKNYNKIEEIFGGEKNIPMICLSNEQQKKLLELSLKYEKEIYPEWFDMDGTESEHRDGFQDYVDRGKFCSWDVKRMLKEKKLQDLMIKILAKFN